MFFHSFTISICVLVLILVPMPGNGKDTRTHIETFKDWNVWLQKDNPRICILSSRPKKSEGKYTRRGDVHLLISRIPSQNRKGEMSIVAGYPYRENVAPKLVIDGKSFTLLPSGERAWSQDAKADAAIVKAMQRGLNAVIHGTSSRGTKTLDRFSLSGFSKAWNAAKKQCPFKKSSS